MCPSGIDIDTGRARDWLRSGRLRGGGNALPGNSPGDADADAQCTTNVSRIHTDYDGSSGSRCLSGMVAGTVTGFGGTGLLSDLNGSKV